MDFINSQLLRSLAAPIRSRFPRAYTRLNALRSHLIRGHNSLALSATQTIALSRFRKLCLKESRATNILEIGSDIDLSVLQALSQAATGQVVGANRTEAVAAYKASLQNMTDGDRIAFVRCDACCCPFPSGAFDHVFSVSTFEHINSLDTALAEIYRVLRPGGMLYTRVGPLWSSHIGHHAFSLAGEEGRALQLENHPLPPFSHLLLSPEEMRSSLREICSDQLAETIVRWTFESQGINRMFFHEYLKIFEESPMTVVSIYPERVPVNRSVLQLLRFKYPSERDFAVTNFEVVLERPM